MLTTTQGAPGVPVMTISSDHEICLKSHKKKLGLSSSDYVYLSCCP
jgi:hypothetical protein